MQHDQPHNARLVEEISVAINVGKGVDGMINREEMVKAVSKVIMEDVRWSEHKRKGQRVE